MGVEDQTAQASRRRPGSNRRPWLSVRVLAWLNPSAHSSWRTGPWLAAGELLLILCWALWVGREYLNLDPNVWAFGDDFPLTLEPYYIWRWLPQCGSCVFWNGLTNGGVPAFVESHGAILHPFVVVSTLVWGVINGAKLTMVASLFMAGAAQWWLARVMRLGPVPRLWVGGMAVVGGHLAGRMELGLVAVVLSLASGAMILAPGIDLGLRGRRRSTVFLGAALALTFLSGQGYIQIGILLAILPAFLVFVIDGRLRPRPVWREFALAGLLSFLLAAVFLVPFLHFSPHFSKHGEALATGGQPLEYVPLNLVIRDPEFYQDESLGKIILPSVNINYIGWVPVLLALVPLRLAGRDARRLLAFFMIAISLVFFFGSGTPTRLLASEFPEIMSRLRYPTLTSGLAVPLVLGMAAWGLDLLLKVDWPSLKVRLRSGPSRGVPATWLVLAVPLLWALDSAYDFGRMWLLQDYPPPQAQAVAEALHTDSAEWVLPPVSHYWIPAILEAGGKVTQVYRPWYWEGRPVPLPRIEAENGPVDPATPGYLGTVGWISLIDHPENEYASVDTGDRQIPCRATALGGNIDVVCLTTEPGTLVVQENQWTGWRAWRDGERIPLEHGPWLEVEAPLGDHEYEFRYRPWDVVLGIVLTVVGIVLAVWLWVTSPRSQPEVEGSASNPAPRPGI